MPSEQGKEREFEAGMDEGFKANAVNSATQALHELSQVNNVGLQALQNAVVATDILTKATIENMNLAAKQSIDHRDNANVLADTATGAVADAMIDQSPPDEGVRQAKVE